MMFYLYKCLILCPGVVLTPRDFGVGSTGIHGCTFDSNMYCVRARNAWIRIMNAEHHDAYKVLFF